MAKDEAERKDRRKRQSTAETDGPSRSAGPVALDEDDHTLVDTLIVDRWPED